MNQEVNLKFTKEHEWVNYDSGSNTATIGITNFAQQSLGDVVFVELPKIGSQVKVGQVVGSVESVKTVSDIYSPLSGEVTAINLQLDKQPELINQKVYNEGWMFKLKVSNSNELNSLLSLEAYTKIIS